MIETLGKRPYWNAEELIEAMRALATGARVALPKIKVWTHGPSEGVPAGELRLVKRLKDDGSIDTYAFEFDQW